MRRFALLIAALGGLFAAPAHACGADIDCRLGDRIYRIYMPDTLKRPTGALIYAHGYRGSAKGAMRSKPMRRLADELGVALVATKSASEDWLIPGVPENPAETGETEFRYYDALIERLVSYHGLDRDKLVVAGFSAGGMMVWNLACHRGQSFAGFIPVAGTFWAPVPESCPSGPVNLIHVHGLKDRIVPLAGRPIKASHQGDVPTALERAAKAGGFGNETDVEGTPTGLACKRRENGAGKILVFCTHPGKHALKMVFLKTAWTMLQNAGAVPR